MKNKELVEAKIDRFREISTNVSKGHFASDIYSFRFGSTALFFGCVSLDSQVTLKSKFIPDLRLSRKTILRQSDIPFTWYSRFHKHSTMVRNWTILISEAFWNNFLLINRRKGPRIFIIFYRFDQILWFLVQNRLKYWKST